MVGSVGSGRTKGDPARERRRPRIAPETRSTNRFGAVPQFGPQDGKFVPSLPIQRGPADPPPKVTVSRGADWASLLRSNRPIFGRLSRSARGLLPNWCQRQWFRTSWRLARLLAGRCCRKMPDSGAPGRTHGFRGSGGISRRIPAAADSPHGPRPRFGLAQPALTRVEAHNLFSEPKHLVTLPPDPQQEPDRHRRVLDICSLPRKTSSARVRGRNPASVSTRSRHHTRYSA